MMPSLFSTGSAGASGTPPIRRRLLSRAAGTTFLWLPAVCVLVPLLAVAWRILGDGGGSWQRIVEYRLLDYLGTTAMLLLLVVALAIVIGVSCAWLVAAFEFPGRRSLQWLLVLPLGVPGFVAGAAYLDGFEQLTPLYLWIRDQFGIEAFLASQRIAPWVGTVLVLVVTLFPYVYLSCRASFARQQADLIEASRTLGAGPGRTFLRVVLPMARPAIAAGAVLVAMETANDYGVVTLFGLNTLTPGVFRAWSEGSVVSAMRLALFLLALVLFFVALERAQRGQRGFAGDTRERPMARRPLRGLRILWAWLICGLPLALGFIWPVSRFIGWSMDAAPDSDWAGYSAALSNSLWLALLASALVVVAAFWLIAGQRAFGLAGDTWPGRLASLGYALPSALLAVGVGALVSFLSASPGMAWLALSASALGLLFAYFIRFMAVGIQPVAGASTRVAGDLHAAARTLGMPPGRALLRVDLRMLLPALAAAGLLCFVDTFKELTLTLVLRPFDFETLATLTYRLSSEGRIPEAAVPALVLVGCGMLGVAIISRLLRDRS